MNKVFKICLIIGLLSLSLMALVACQELDLEKLPEDQTGELKADAKLDVAEGYERSDQVTEYVDIRMDSGQHIVIQLLPEYAPLTVANFQKLVEEKFYDGLIFHRVIDGFMIQGGDPLGTGMGGTEDKVVGEFINNGIANDLKHKRGVISLGRAPAPDSGSCQFFICQVDCPHLDGSYAGFGMTLVGLDEVDRIAKLERDGNDRPLEPPVMEEVFFVQPVK